MDWFAKRREVKAQEQWEIGYDWAELSPKEIDDQLYEVHHPFDRGARYAVDHLIKIGIAQEYDRE